MKPTLDRVVNMIVDSLSGEAQQFYSREFTFFDEVTSISAKLKPFIKSSKAEKKVKHSLARVHRKLIASLRDCRRKSMRKWPRSRWMSEFTFRVILTVLSSMSIANPVDLCRVTPK